MVRDAARLVGGGASRFRCPALVENSAPAGAWKCVADMRLQPKRWLTSARATRSTATAARCVAGPGPVPRSGCTSPPNDNRRATSQRRIDDHGRQHRTRIRRARQAAAYGDRQPPMLPLPVSGFCYRPGQLPRSERLCSGRVNAEPRHRRRRTPTTRPHGSGLRAWPVDEIALGLIATGVIGVLFHCVGQRDADLLCLPLSCKAVAHRTLAGWGRRTRTDIARGAERRSIGMGSN
jgi:hypothetical protein